MHLLVFIGVLILSGDLITSQMHSDTLLMDSRVQNSCEIGQRNFNRSCIYHKIVFLIQKLPYITNFSPLHAGPVQLVKLPDYASSIMSVTEEKPKFRSYSSNIMSLISKGVEYFMESYGIKIPIPSLSKNFPGIVVEEVADANEQIEEGRRKKKDKKFAMVFPLIAIFKFILIKALLIPILMGIVAIKKMLVVAAMAVPTIIAMLRICRFGPGNIGGIFPGAAGLSAAATAPILAPYVASDTIIGDFSNYAPLSQTPYYSSKQQQDYGGKSYF